MHVMWRKGKRTTGQGCVGPQCVTVSGSNARLCLLVLLNGIKARSMWAAKARSSFSLWAVIINTDAVTLNAQAAFCHLCKHKEEVVTRLVIPSSRVILICTLVLQII